MSSVKKFYLPLLIFFGVLFLYIHNLSRGTYGGDVGDLLSASLVMGVAHPPGYPLFTILGFLLSRINLVTPAFMVGLISAFSGALGVLIFYFTSLELTKSRVISLISSILLAFSYYFWLYSEVAEVFALNNFFVILLFYLALMYSLKKDIKYLFLTSFFTGLSMTNHQTIIFIFPSLLILSLPNLLRDLRNYKNIIYCILLGLLGFSPYLYVFYAAAHNPPINWDHVKDINSFLHLFLRQDYGTLSIGQVSPPTVSQRIASFKIYFFDILVQATIPAIIIIILGILYSIKRKLKYFLALFFAFILSGPVFIVYAGFPLFSSFNVGVYERFIIMSFVILLMFFPLGLLTLRDLFDKIFTKKELSILVIGIFIIIPFSLFRFNYPKTNLSNFTAGNDVAYDLLEPLPKNSVLILSGDTLLFNTWYVHYGLGYRKDVQVLNLSGLTGSSYFAKKLDNYLKSNPGQKESPDLVANVIMEIAKTNPVFSILNIEKTKGQKLVWVPYGLSSKLVLNGKIPQKQNYEKDAAVVWGSYKIPYKTTNDLVLGNLTASDIPLFYSNRLITTANFIVKNYNDKPLSFYYFKKSYEVDSANPAVSQVLGNYYIQQKECFIAEKYLKSSIGSFPYEPLSYFLLYYDYMDCFKSVSGAENVIKEYSNQFHTDFYSDIKKTFKQNNNG